MQLTPTSLIHILLIGINSASKWIKQPSVADPEFEVVSAGLGSMLHVRLPTRSELYAAPGAAVGSSADVRDIALVMI